MIALDTNLLVYAHRADCAEHKRSVAAVAKAAKVGVATTSICVLEFITVVTADNFSQRQPSTLRDCAKFFEDFRSQCALAVLTPASDFDVKLLEIAGKLGVRGRRLHDLAIGLMAREGGARELWTHDESFVAPLGLRVRTPVRGAF